jgi:hypothetical protein
MGNAYECQFLDFQRWKEWHEGRIFTLTTLDSGKRPVDLQPGERIKIDMKGTSFNPKIVVGGLELFPSLIPME